MTHADVSVFNKEVKQSNNYNILKKYRDVNDSRPIHIYFIKKDSNGFDPKIITDIGGCLRKKIILVDDWCNMAELFKLEPESISVNAAHLVHTSLLEIITMIETFSRLVNLTKEITISLAIHKDTPYNLIKEAQKSKILGIVPEDDVFGAKEFTQGLETQWDNRPYWPKNIINQLPGAKPKLKLVINQKNLTVREQQIFDIVTTRGCSNKHAAKLLGLAESTVKLHMSAIFKKCGVKNRTQLAVFSKQ